jgi:chemotaxis protein MotB
LFRGKAALSATASLLKEQNQGLISTSKDMTILSTKVLKILKSVRIYQRERFKISRMQDALTKKIV